MILYHMLIERFRGIRHLDWHVGGRVVCLVGPGDSTKTTVLDAIERVLHPGPFFQFADADFYKRDVSQPLVVEATIGELPEELIKEDRFGLFLRGYGERRIEDEPIEGCAKALTVRLSVDRNLEPVWEVVKEAVEGPRTISWRDREKMGMVRLGESIDRHLTWARGSALNRLTEGDASAGGTFVDAVRSARDAVSDADLPGLHDAAKRAGEAALLFGAGIGDAKAGLDPISLFLGASSLGLHADNVPVRQHGLGTRRLAALAIQQQGVGRDQVVLIDELEHALEPHRQRHLLRLLRTTGGTQDRETGQVIFSTHSPTPIMALDASHVRIVRSKDDGETTVTPVPTSLQDVVRGQSLAFLAKRVMVCEGKTEEGMIRGLEPWWEERHSGKSLALLGVVPVCGVGSNAHGLAEALRSLGFVTALFCDTDRTTSPSSQCLMEKGIDVCEWEGMMSTEERIAHDLPVEQLQELLGLVLEEHDNTVVLSSLASNVGTAQATALGTDLAASIAAGVSEADLRRAFGAAAKGGRWFKNLTAGESLGSIVARALPEMTGTSLAKTLSKLEKWVYG